MLKIIKSIRPVANLEKIDNKTSGNSMIGDSIIGGSEVTNPKSPTKGKNQAKTTKSKILLKSKNCEKIASINWLKRWNLWLNTHYCW